MAWVFKLRSPDPALPLKFRFDEDGPFAAGEYVYQVDYLPVARETMLSGLEQIEWLQCEGYGGVTCRLAQHWRRPVLKAISYGTDQSKLDQTAEIGLPLEAILEGGPGPVSIDLPPGTEDVYYRMVFADGGETDVQRIHIR